MAESIDVVVQELGGDVVVILIRCPDAARF